MTFKATLPAIALYGQGTVLTVIGLIALFQPGALAGSEEAIAGTSLALQIKIMSMLSLTLGPYSLAGAALPAMHRRLIWINIAARALAVFAFWSDAPYTAYYEGFWLALNVAAIAGFRQDDR